MSERNCLKARNRPRHLPALNDPTPELVLATEDRLDRRRRQTQLARDQWHQHAGGVVIQLQDAVEALGVGSNLSQHIGYERVRIAAERVGSGLVIADADKFQSSRAWDAREQVQIFVRYSDEHEAAAARSRGQGRRFRQSSLLGSGGTTREEHDQPSRWSGLCSEHFRTPEGGSQSAAPATSLPRVAAASRT